MRTPGREAHFLQTYCVLHSSHVSIHGTAWCPAGMWAQLTLNFPVFT